MINYGFQNKKTNEVDLNTRNIFNQLSLLYLEIGKDFKCRHCNPAFTSISGLKSQDIRGKAINSIFNQNKIIYTKIAIALKGKPIHFHQLLRFPNGAKIPCYINITPSKTKRNEVNGCYFVIENKSELVKSNEKILELNNKIEAILDVSNTGTMLMDEKGTILLNNKAAQRFLGYKNNELIGEQLSKIIHVDHQKKIEKTFHDLVESYTAFDISKQKHIKKNGQEVWSNFSLRSIKNQSQKTNYIVAMLAEAEEKSKTPIPKSGSSSDFKDVFRHSKVGMALIGPYGKYFKINKALESFMGYSKEILTKETFTHFLHEADVEKNIKQHNRLFKGEIESYILENRYILSDNSIVWGNIKISAFKDQNNKVIYAIAMIEDITEKKQANLRLETYKEELKNLVEELQIANRDLEAFAYSISHDLRAPLRYIGSFTHLLQRKIEDPSLQLAQYMNNIQQSVSDMSNMIDSLPTFSKLGRTGIKTQKINTNQLIGEVIKELVPQTKNQVINWQIGSLPNIQGDYFLMKMVFENLISNAIKFTSKKRVATIEINTLPSENNKNIIYIKDNGAGFDMAFINKLFGVFQRLHHSDEFEGTGIGLANIKRILDRHNASIRAEGAVNKGATFYISI